MDARKGLATFAIKPHSPEGVTIASRTHPCFEEGVSQAVGTPQGREALGGARL